jgi:two-component system, LytTR family, sensor kinase
MKEIINRENLRLYLWMGLLYAALWLFHNLATFTGTFWQAVLNNIWRVAYVLVLNFVFFEYSIPLVLRKRRFLIANILWGILLLWIHLMLWSYGLYAWRLLGIGIGVYTAKTAFTSLDKALESQMAYSAGSVFFFGIIRHIYHYIRLKQTAQQLRIEKQEAELNYLKSQTNPHFLFNTLNNIYSLARDKSDRAPESILRLSKMLRYMLYETGGDYIAVEQELKIISDYIELEKLRYDESLRINFNYDVEDRKQAVPPLLLMPLVENAFKHGASETRGRPFVDIHLSINRRKLQFIVKNSSETLSAGEGIQESIGLSNLRRQLVLLYKEYDLSVQQKDAVFTVVLTINLASHV